MHSQIFKKALYGSLALIAVYLTIIFVFIVPDIERSTITLEERIGETQLQKTVEIVKSASLEMQTYSKIALEEHKKSLIRLTSIAKQIIEQKEKESRGLTVEGIKQKQKEALDLISKLSYNNDDYFYVSNYDNVLIAHPYLRGEDFTNIKDIDGNLIVPPLVEVARKNGKGFTN